MPQVPHLPPDSLFLWPLDTYPSDLLGTCLSRHSFLISYSFLPWPAIQILMHLRHGRIKPKTRTTPIVLHSPQQHLRPPHPSSLSTRLRLRAPPRPPLAGRARLGTARTRMRLTTLRTATSHDKVIRIRQTKKTSHHTYLALSHKRTHQLKPLPSRLDSTRGGRNVSTPVNLKMESPCRHVLDHHHLWCDKVNEKKTSSIVLLVS